MAGGTQATERRLIKKTLLGGLIGVIRALTCFVLAVKITAKALGDGADRFIYAQRFFVVFFCMSSTRHRKVVQNPQATGRGEEVVVKPNTAGGSMGRARCRHRKVVQNPHSVQANTHDYFLRRPTACRLHQSSRSGPDMIISCGDLRLVGSSRHRKVVQNPHSIYNSLKLENCVSKTQVMPPVP